MGSGTSTGLGAAISKASAEDLAKVCAQLDAGVHQKLAAALDTMASEVAEDAQVETDCMLWSQFESSPDVLNNFASRVGMPTGWEFQEVFGTDPDLLAMLPTTCVAVTLLFDQTDNFKKAKREQLQRIEKDGQEVAPGVIHMKQHVGNACGAMAVMHSIMNNAEVMGIDGESTIGQFMSSIVGKTPDDAGMCLSRSSELHSATQAAASAGAAPVAAESAGTDWSAGCHFIAFVEKGGDIYEMDGLKVAPINHGPSEGNFLEKACAAIKANFIDNDPESVSMNMMALVKPE